MNTEAKYLMLRHAFETLGAMRVELKTDSLNERSRRAILRLGVTSGSTWTTESGRVRHTVYFSIVDKEWAGVKARLRGWATRGRGGGCTLLKIRIFLRSKPISGVFTIA